MSEKVKTQEHLCGDPFCGIKVIFSETREKWALQVGVTITGTNILMIGITYCPWCGEKLSK